LAAVCKDRSAAVPSRSARTIQQAPGKFHDLLFGEGAAGEDTRAPVKVWKWAQPANQLGNQGFKRRPFFLLSELLPAQFSV